MNKLFGDGEANTGAELEDLAQLLLKEAHQGWDQPAGRVRGAGHDQQESMWLMLNKQTRPGPVAVSPSLADIIPPL